MAGIKTQKLIQYQQTQNLLQGINAQEQLPPDQTETSNYFALSDLRHRVEQRDRSVMRSHLETLVDVLNEDEKLKGIPDPLKYEYSRLLDRLNLGEPVSLSEFEGAVKKFSLNHAYMVALQDEINNKKLDLEVNPEETGESGQPSGILDDSEAGLESDEGQMPGQEPGGQGESSGNQPTRQAPRREPQRVVQQIQETPEEERERIMQKARDRREARRLRKEERKERRKGRRRTLLQKPTAKSGWGFNPLDARFSKWLADKLGITKFGKWLADKTINPLLNSLAQSRLGQYLANALRPAMDLFNKIASPFKAINHALGAPERWLNSQLGNFGNWLGSGIRSLGGQALRAGLNQLSNLWNVGKQFLAPGGGLGTAVWGSRVFLLGIAANPITWAVVGLSAAFFGFSWYVSDINSECGKPGVVELTKSASANKETFQLGETIEYKISVVYKIRCRTAYAAATVRDRIPTNTTYVPGSAKSSIPFSTGFISISGPGPDGILDGDTLIWKLDYLGPDEPNTLTFSVTPNQTDIWIANQATLTYQTGALGSGGKIIDSQSRSFQETVNKAAEINGMPPALMKAVLAVEAPDSLRYSEEEFLKFSRTGWWEGLESNAETIEGNHPDAIRGYAYNTCAYRSCAAGADVRGVAQFELRTWQGVVPKLKFTDSHEPDRRNATDSIFGSALHNRENAEIYTGSSGVEWTEDVVRAMARVYCAGPSAARNPSKVKDPACGGNYDDLVWDRYRQFLEQP